MLALIAAGYAAERRHLASDWTPQARRDRRGRNVFAFRQSG
jgi:hypothetical protein